jgi:hypothetical protein
LGSTGRKSFLPTDGYRGIVLLRGPLKLYLLSRCSELCLVSSDIDVQGVAASLAAIIHDFWLADRCAPRFLENGAVGNAGTISVATELPRVRYITCIDQLRESTTPK